MANIIIEDLVESTELDAHAMSVLVGGYFSGFSWLRVHAPSQGSFQYPAVNNYYTLNQFIADEIQIINQEQFVNINNSDGAQVDLNEDANNDLATIPSIPGLP